IGSGDSNNQDGPVNTASWSGGYSKGATSITLSNTANLAVGNPLILDQLDDSSDGGDIYVCGAGGVCTTQGANTGRSGRGQNQIVRVTSISGSTVGIAP